jgi:hypothetical protein
MIGDAAVIPPTVESIEEAERISMHLAAVGLVASTWAAFEFALDVSAIILARISQHAGYCFTAQVIGPARKLDAYIALAKLRGATTFAGELEKFAKDTAALAERRNRIIHDTWFLTTRPKPSRLEITARRVLKHAFVEVSREDIMKLVNQIDAHTARFDALHARIAAEVGT